MNDEIIRVSSEQLASFEAVLRDKRVVLLKRVLGRGSAMHLVGGAVRDIMRCLPTDAITSRDLDLATRLLPQDLLTILTSAGIRCIPTGLKHQTVTVKPYSDLEQVELTTFRGKNMSPAGGVVAADSIVEDLRYRDFSVNAMAYCLFDKKLLDPHGGLADIRAKLIRAVGDPNARFGEDPLRVLRMVRLSCELGFSIEKRTEDAAREFRQQIIKLSVERIRDELGKVLLSPSPRRGFILLHELGILSEILPEVASFVGFEQNRYHAADLFTHTLEVVQNTPKDLVLRLAALLHDVGKPASLTIDEETGERHFYKHEALGADIAKEILERLRYSSNINKDVSTLVRMHMRPLNAGRGGLRRLLRDVGSLFPLWRALKIADATACKYGAEILKSELGAFDDEIERIRLAPDVSPLATLAINGKDLLALGFREGPEIGKILRALHEKVLDDPTLNKKDHLLALLPSVTAPPPKT
ncbi:MAG: CCA tRNA nucleotidyltransferase [Deltaproteobacteria bacterium]|nr:CCA tRNA nucleotidyltransferase [Deltaproteobacteria bacterium]